MPDWLTKFLQPNAPKTTASKRQVVAAKSNALPAKSGNASPVRNYVPAEPAQLPNASIIYGIAASILLVIAILFLFRGMWGTFLVVLLPAFCFLGLAIHFLKHPNA